MKILVVGASGFIGLRLYKFLKESSNYQIWGTYYLNKKDRDLIPLNILSNSEIEKTLDKIRPDVIIWAAGNKNIRFCQENIEESNNVNTKPIENVLNILNSCAPQMHFIYISTDYVFDGARGDYSVLDRPKPTTGYGLSKFLAEIQLIENFKNYTIVRTSAVMGRGGTFFDWITKELQKDTFIELFENSFFSPTPINFLLEKIFFLIREKKIGIFHVCGSMKFSRYEFANLIKSLSQKFKARLKPFCLDEKCTLFQKNLSMIPSDFAFLNDIEFIDYLKKEI